MTTVLLIVLVVVAAALGVALVLTRNSAAERQAQAEARENELRTERDRLTEVGTRLGRDLEGAKGEIEQLTATSRKQSTEIDQLNVELTTAKKTSAEQQTRIENQATEISALVTDNNALHTRAEVAEAERSEAEARAVAAEAREVGVVVGPVTGDDALHSSTLWDLELSRSERTWRNSVAVDPSTPDGPFDDTDDPVRLAVEIEAAALRENVGAQIIVDWQAGPVTEPARQHLIVRVAQEMLEAAARQPDSSRLVVTGDDEVTISLDAESEDPLSIIPPHVSSELIEVKESTGRSIIVKAE